MWITEIQNYLCLKQIQDKPVLWGSVQMRVQQTFYKGPEQLKFCRPQSLCCNHSGRLYYKNNHLKYLKGWVWFCSNKTLLKNVVCQINLWALDRCFPDLVQLLCFLQISKWTQWDKANHSEPTRQLVHGQECPSPGSCHKPAPGPIFPRSFLVGQALCPSLQRSGDHFACESGSHMCVLNYVCVGLVNAIYRC